MSILDYIGSSLEKPGRAVRGLLAGRPQEAMAAIPFSDTMGLTNPDDKVSGHDLLSLLGADPGDGIGGTLAGIGADVATDPLTYLGGYLARRLLGGGFRTVAKGAEEMLPAEYDLTNRYAHMPGGGFRNGFPGETGRMNVPVALPRRPIQAELVPEAGSPLVEALPQPQPTTLPDPRRGMLGPIIGMDEAGAIRPHEFGLQAEMGEGFGEHMAFTGNLGNWESILNDLRAPSMIEARQGIGDAAVPHGEDWLRALNARYNDLSAVQRLQGAVPGYEQMAGQVEKQADRIAGLQSLSMRSNPTLHAANDLANGTIMPSEARAYAAQHLSHLPLDPAAVRDIAARAQLQEAGQTVQGWLAQVARDDHPLLDALGTFPPEYVQRQLEGATSLQALIKNGFEPGIAKQALRNPDLAPRLAEARELLARLRAGEFAPHGF